MRSSGIPADLGEELNLRRNGHRPITFTAAELMAKELPPMREVVPGVVPEGVTLFVGKPKMRKTLTALGLCVAVSTAGVAFGKIPVEREEALYLALEDNERRIQKRLRTILPDGADPTGFHVAPPLSPPAVTTPQR
jgi:hypothetical protein